ncbi:MAG TPA: alpha/beta hydrolase [Polyangiaceae bacterium]|nr:alpha/beta hydrolase [Polyangiaceae bacterium]
MSLLRRLQSGLRLSNARARVALWLIGGAVALGVLLQLGLSVAIAAAPNVARWSQGAAASPPVQLLERGARAFHSPLADGAGSLSAWVLEPPEPLVVGTIVLLHGVRMDKQASIPMALSLCDAGYRAVLVDLPGHGESGGRYLTYGDHEAHDVSGLLDALDASGVALGPVGVFGFSYGAAVAIDLAAIEPRVRGVVAVSPFASLREVVRDYRRKYLPAAAHVLPDDWFQQAVSNTAWFVGFDPDESAPAQRIRASSAPTLLIHGDADTQVPLRHSQALARAAAGRAELLVLHGGTHDSMPADANHLVRDGAVAWFDAKLRSANHHGD